MTLNDAFEGHSLKSTQIVQKGSLIALAVAASLLLAFSHRNGIMLAAVLAICVVAAPTVWMLTRRMLEKVRQRETEDRLMMHTRTYLRQEEPVVVAAKPAAEESDIEILARAIDGSKLPIEDFRISYGVASMLPVGEPVVFDALPRRYAIRGVYERRFADLSSTLPRPARLPLRELLPAAATQEIGDWTAGPQSPAIEFANGVQDEIRLRAAEGHQRVRHGGVEVGGVLYGARRDGVLRIQAVRPIECDYTNGPRFALSKTDQARLAELLSSGDPALAGLEPAGYYHSHTREEICLSEGDLRLFNRFFPLPWQVALVVRPANLAPTRAGFFFREPDGALRTDSSYKEFQL